jgi:hypothetical protein
MGKMSCWHDWIGENKPKNCNEVTANAIFPWRPELPVGDFCRYSLKSILNLSSTKIRLAVLKYIKTAFVQPWNLLLFAGGVGFALLSGHPDVAIPVVVAGELLYLGFLGTHPRFQSYVEAQQAKSLRAEKSQKNSEILHRILRTIPRRLHDKYEALRSRCRELHQIAADLKEPGVGDTHIDFESLQVEGLDRLLWVYLRLLFTQFSLERFFETVSGEKIEADMQRLQFQLSQVKSNDNSVQAEKVRHTITDNLKTTQERLENFKRAEGNYQYVMLELDRLENKIKSLAELAVNRQDPDFISSQVDAVANSMRDTEKTMNDLQFVTGLGQVDEEVPELMRTPVYINE